MAFYVFYIWVLAVYNFKVRFKAIKDQRETAKYFKTFFGQPPSERVHTVGRHFDNQFQAPIIFLIVCLVYITMDSVNHFTIFLAWLFILTRFAHSWIHLGSNRLTKRFYAFAAGWLILLLMWGQLVWFALIS